MRWRSEYYFSSRDAGLAEDAGKYRAIREPRHGRDYRAGIDAAAEKRAERDIADQTDAHGLQQFFANALDPFVFGANFWRGEISVPIFAVLHRAVFEDNHVAGENFLD